MLANVADRALSGLENGFSDVEGPEYKRLMLFAVTGIFAALCLLLLAVGILTAHELCKADERRRPGGNGQSLPG